MPNNPVNDILGSGTLRTKSGSALGPTDTFQSRITVDSDGVLRQYGNNGSIVEQLLGDGRHVTPILSPTPGGLAPGQYFLEQFGGLDYFVFIDSLGNPQRLRPLTIFSGDIPVPVGPAVTIDVFLTDDFRYAAYDYSAYNPVSGAQISGQIQIGHDGTNSSDAVNTQLDQTLGIAFGVPEVTFAAVLSGVGPGQLLSLEATAVGGNWSVAFTRRMAS